MSEEEEIGLDEDVVQELVKEQTKNEIFSDMSDPTDGKGDFFENQLQFNSELIRPASTKKFLNLNKDAVLGNLSEAEVDEVRRDLDFSNLLTGLGLDGIGDLFHAKAAGLLIVSRSKDGFQQKQLNTSYSYGQRQLTLDQGGKEKKKSALGRLLKRGK